ncbi:kelch repeat and BTB domain-containing protein 13 [Megalops cyprinoides]|uniref:kelch repeat and BTB domain-containing protein 13 n=1 Tax=Megalops cyprinoides TaxID=118141 RepID=UPI0018646A2B|nr:kelch repeat and BTB domain-containing protein 13 [Megalops cyprinoides]
MGRTSCRGLEGESQELSHKPGRDCEMATLRVRVEESVFAVERATLVRDCEYFRALFRSGMRECQQEEVHVKGLRARGFLIALGVLRGERPILTGEEIIEVAECAAFLQVAPLEKHLINIINSDNCLLMYHTAATYGLLDLYHSAALFIRDMYRDLEDDAKCLPEELLDYVESLAPSTYVTVGTHSPTIELLQDFVRTVCYLDEDEKEWKVLTDLPIDASTTMAGVTVLDNKLYIVGGVRDVSNQVVVSCYCYDPETDTWTTFCSPRQLRYNFTLVGHEGYLYAIGGEYERTTMSSVERYQVSTGNWSFVSHLPRPVAGAACAKAMSRIFVCLWRPMDATDIYEYVPVRDEWVLVTTLIRHQSYGHCMVAHRDNLYVMRNGPSDDFLRCMMDCYNLTTGQWTAMPGQYENSKGALFTAVVRGDSVFTVNRKMTLEYIIEGKKWKPKKEMNGFPRIGSMWTFLLRLPKTGRQPEGQRVLNGNGRDLKNHVYHHQSYALQCSD